MDKNFKLFIWELVFSEGHILAFAKDIESAKKMAIQQHENLKEVELSLQKTPLIITKEKALIVYGSIYSK